MRRSIGFAVLLTILLSPIPVISAGASEIVNRIVRVETANPSVVLEGTLTLPGDGVRFPAVIMLQGEGPHTRDQEISGSPMFRLLSDHFAKNGMAVLRVDKRGIGGSTGPSEEESSLEDLASDAKACFSFLQEVPEIDRDRIGFLGHSQGALVAPIVALHLPDVRFLVLLSAPAIPGADIWIAQQITNARRLGMEEETILAVSPQLHRVAGFIISDFADDETFYRIGREFLAAHGLPEDQITVQLVDGILGGLRNRWTQSFFAHDPYTILSELDVPVLACFGAQDKQVTTAQNLVPLARALSEGSNPDFAISVIPDQDHFFLEFEGRRLDKHEFGKMEVADELLEVVTRWIHRHVGGTPTAGTQSTDVS